MKIPSMQTKDSQKKKKKKKGMQTNVLTDK